ncbi:MAG: hypothetical protein ACRDJN_30370, partial [Chloroflexota bacterium]
MAEQDALLGQATLDPAGEVIASSYGTWRLTYMVGAGGIAPGGRIRISTECDTDWGVPQLHDPAGAEYLTVAAPAEARLAVAVQDDKGRLLLTVLGRGLLAGEHVVVTYGDRSRGGPGSRSQTFLEPKRYFRVDVDTDGSGALVALPDPPYVSIVGGEAVRLVVVAPSTIAAGAPFRLLVRAEDAWGNPAQAYRGTVTLQSAGIALPATSQVAGHTFGVVHGGVWWLEGCVAPEAGLHTVTASDEAAGLEAESNPIRCTVDAPEQTLYWGDPHGGQVADAAKIPDFFRYARDVAGISFAGYQRNDHVHSNDDYAAQQAAEREFHQPERRYDADRGSGFVPLPGFEWSGEPGMGGHHNVYFRRHGQPMRRNSHRGLADTSDAEMDLPHVLDLHRAYRGTDTLI